MVPRLQLVTLPVLAPRAETSRACTPPLLAQAVNKRRGKLVGRHTPCVHHLVSGRGSPEVSASGGNCSTSRRMSYSVTMPTRRFSSTTGRHPTGTGASFPLPPELKRPARSYGGVMHNGE
jgi:hypothetical protein